MACLKTWLMRLCKGNGFLAPLEVCAVAEKWLISGLHLPSAVLVHFYSRVFT